MKFSLALSFSLALIASSVAANKPNILIILADDLGYGDVSCNNPQRGKIPTANIDRHAAQGMRFTDGHSSSGVCSPSRYTLLTGRYHWRTRLQSGIVSVFGAPLIAPDRMTIASLVKKYGYQTAAIGKWHLGWDWPVEKNMRHLLQASRKPGEDDEAKPAANSAVATADHQAAWRDIFSKPILGGPTTRGFDSYFGTDVPNWPPFCFIENDRTLVSKTQSATTMNPPSPNARRASASCSIPPGCIQLHITSIYFPLSAPLIKAMPGWAETTSSLVFGRTSFPKEPSHQ